MYRETNNTLLYTSVSLFNLTQGRESESSLQSSTVLTQRELNKVKKLDIAKQW